MIDEEVDLILQGRSILSLFLAEIIESTNNTIDAISRSPHFLIGISDKGVAVNSNVSPLRLPLE